MATSSILGGEHIPEQVSGKDIDALGPSDNSDSGSDAQGAYGDGESSSDSDAVGTGERATVGGGSDRAGSDILPDHIERFAQTSGDGLGLDEIEEDETLDDTSNLAVDDEVEPEDEGAADSTDAPTGS